MLLLNYFHVKESASPVLCLLMHFRRMIRSRTMEGAWPRQAQRVVKQRRAKQVSATCYELSLLLS